MDYVLLVLTLSVAEEMLERIPLFVYTLYNTHCVVRIINLQFVVSEDEESVGDVKGVDSCLCSVQSTADQKVLIRTRVGKSSI